MEKLQLNRCVKKKFDNNNSSTLGINYSFKEIKFNNNDKIKLKLVDTAGQEKYKSLTKSYFKNVDVVLFVFNMNEKETFDNIKDWMELFNNNNSKEDIPKYLVGNKSDLQINVEQSLIDEFEKESKIPYMSISAKDNKNIDELFEKIWKKLYFDYQQKGDKGQTDLEIKIKKKQKNKIKIKKKQKNNCCLGPDP